jgi:hypothetical protein
MKGFISVFISMVFWFSICQAQDTIVLKNGKKLGVKVISVVENIVYSIPPSDSQMLFNRSKIWYVKYEDGAISTINPKVDRGNNIGRPYFVFSGGINIPILGGYGGNTYDDDIEDYGYSGYANNGSILSVTSGIKLSRIWEFTGMFSYLRNEFDAAGFMNETYNIFIWNTIPPGKGIEVGNIIARGSYYYKNYSLLFGTTRDIQNKYGEAGISLMVGYFITYVPSIIGITTPLVSSEKYYFNLDSESEANFILELVL